VTRAALGARSPADARRLAGVGIVPNWLLLSLTVDGEAVSLKTGWDRRHRRGTQGSSSRNWPTSCCPRFPSQLADRFGERRFIPLDALFLDYEAATVALWGEAMRVAGTLAIPFDAKRETAKTAGLFSDLRMEAAAHPTRLLFEGR
jgi:hypothetical protein